MAGIITQQHCYVLRYRAYRSSITYCNFLLWYFRGTCPSAFVTQLQLPWGSSPLTLSKHTNTSMRLVLFLIKCMYMWYFVMLWGWKLTLNLWRIQTNVFYLKCDHVYCSVYRCIMQKRSDGTNRVRAKTPVTKKRGKSLTMAMTMITMTTSSRMGRSGWTAMRLIPW